MQQPAYRALVVDDEAVVCQLTIRALNREGFTCKSVSDGQSALELIERGEQFDVVITDLHMPRKHGHALAVDLLSRPDRPLLIVLTGLVEPRLAKDLLARGVDDIVWKPVAYASFAAKVRMLVDRRQKSGEQGGEGQARPNVPRPLPLTQIGLPEIESRLPLVPTVLPVSQAAFEVFSMTNAEQYSAEEIAAAIARDPALTAEVLRVANGLFYNPSGKRITDLETAIARIGQKRIGELAMASNALAAMTRAMLPWMDLDLAWQRSIAAGVAIELLIAQSGSQNCEQGLLLGAIMQGLGRVILGTLYKDHYEQMVQNCRLTGDSLQKQEAEVFPENHAQILGRLLHLWNIPTEIQLPLMQTLDPYASLAVGAPQRRTKVELLKLAYLVGEMAIGRWEEWDHLDLPPKNVLDRLNLRDLDPLIDQTREDLEHILQFRVSGERRVTDSSSRASNPPTHRIAYCDLSLRRNDLVERLLRSMDLEPTLHLEPSRVGTEPLLVNCIELEPAQAAERLSRYEGSQMTILCSSAKRDVWGEWGTPLALPCSYGRLRSACQALKQPFEHVAAQS